MRRSLALAALLCSAAYGAVDGVVMNRTTGKPQPGATVTLYKLGQNGLESVESVKPIPKESSLSIRICRARASFKAPMTE